MKRQSGRRGVVIGICAACALVLGIVAANRVSGPLGDSNAAVAAVELKEHEQQQGQNSKESADSTRDSSSLAPVNDEQEESPAVVGAPDVVLEDQHDQTIEDGQLSEVFVMPEDVDYEPNVALVSVDPSAPVEQVNEAFRNLEGIVPVEISAEEVSSGLIRVPLAQNTSVEDGVNELLSTGVVSGAQPNYLYDVSELMEEAGAAVEPEDKETGYPAEGAYAPQDAAGGEQADEQVANEDVLENEEEQSEAVNASQEEQAASDSASPSNAVGNVADAANNDSELKEEGDSVGLKAENADDLSATLEEDGDSANTVTAEVSKVSVNDPMAGEQWGLSSIQAYEAWALQKVSGSVTVAVIDLGFDLTHPDLKGNLLPGYNAYDHSSNIPESDYSNHGHGTHVTGVIAGVSNNKNGISGVSYNAKILPIMIAYKNGNSSKWVASTETLNNAYDYAVKNSKNHNMRVINMSVGVNSLGNEVELEKKIRSAYRDQNIVTVASAGNIASGGSPSAHYPSDVDECVAVMSLEKTDHGVKRSSLSNYNVNSRDHKDIGAPGVDILSTYADGGYTSLTGSSMATPFVSGILALEFAAKPSLTAEEAVNILYATAIDLGASGWDVDYGWGEANAYAAVYGVKYGISEGKRRAVEEQSRRQREEQLARDEAAAKSLRYRTHVENVGWQEWKSNGEMSGTQGRSLRLEGIKMALSSAPYSGGIQYRTHVQNVGWQGWKSNGALSGTSGQSLRLEAIEIQLTGQMADHYDVWYRVHAQDYGWLGWTKNGERAGTATYSKRLEAIEVRILPAGSAAPGDTNRPYVTKQVSYKTHVQNQGWQNSVSDGATSGTVGKSRRLEAIEISLPDQLYSGGIRYRTHVQNVGWQGWRSNGAMSGTSGRSLRLEAIEIQLTGQMADHYDVWYRVHCQNIGWMGWAKNGGRSGTSGFSYRLEGIQICLVPKGGSAPGSTADSFRQR